MTSIDDIESKSPSDLPSSSTMISDNNANSGQNHPRNNGVMPRVFSYPVNTYSKISEKCLKINNNLPSASRNVTEPTTNHFMDNLASSLKSQMKCLPLKECGDNTKLNENGVDRTIRDVENISEAIDGLVLSGNTETHNRLDCDSCVNSESRLKRDGCEFLESKNVSQDSNRYYQNGINKTPNMNVLSVTPESEMPVDELDDTVKVPAENSNDTEDSNENSCTGDTSNDDSLSDDFCVYTYKGGGVVADLPDCFFVDLEASVPEVPLQPIPNIAPPSRSSSPEMDFLEMDFDPEPSCEGESEPITNELSQRDHFKKETNQSVFPVPSKTVVQSKPAVDYSNSPSTSTDIRHNCGVSTFKPVTNCHRPKKFYRKKNYQNSKLSDCSSDSDTEILESFNNSNDAPAECMLWSEKEASYKQFLIPNASSGANAVLGALTILGKISPGTIPDCINNAFAVKQLKTDISLPEFLIEKSQMGPTQQDLIDILHKASDSGVYARFFPTYPERNVDYSHWLAHWLKHGVVPIISKNIHHRPTKKISESWHYQIVFGIDSNGIYVTDPVRCIARESFNSEICSESVISVPRVEILSRWTNTTNLSKAVFFRHRKWQKLNVFGKLVNILRESRDMVSERPNCYLTESLTIPSTCSAGVILVSDVNTTAFQMLKRHPNLPIRL